MDLADGRGRGGDGAADDGAEALDHAQVVLVVRFRVEGFGFRF